MAHTNIGRLGCARADQAYIVPVSFIFDRADWWLPGTAKTAPETEHHVPIVYRIRIEQMMGRNTSVDRITP